MVAEHMVLPAIRAGQGYIIAECGVRVLVAARVDNVWSLLVTKLADDLQNTVGALPRNVFLQTCLSSVGWWLVIPCCSRARPYGKCLSVCVCVSASVSVSVSVSLSVCLCLCLCLCLCPCLCLCCVCVCMSACLPACLSVCLSVRPSIGYIIT